MKIRSFFAGLVMAAAVFTGCEPKEELGMPDVTFGATELEFTQEAGSKDMKFTATREWKAVYDADWIAVTPETGKGSNAEQTVTVTVTENTKGNRSAKVTITIGMVEKAFTVNQAGPDGDTGGVEALTVKEFIEKADTENYYRLTGTVSGFNASYCSFDITDETGKIYVYSVTEESKAEWSGKIKNGGTVVLQGKYEFYEAKSQHEVVDAIIESFTAGEEEDLSKVQTISCAEFIEKADPNTTYRLVGEVVSSVNTTYCSFDMNDGTGKVVVWTVNNKDEWKDVVKKGGTVTVRGKYMLYTTADGTVKHEMVDAYIEKFEDGSSSDNTGDQTEEKWYVYKKAAAVESGKAYLIVAEGKAGISYEASANYGYLKTVGVTDNNGEIVASGNNAFIFTSVEGGYTVSQAVDGRYLTMEGDYNSFNLSADAPGANGVFTVEEGSEGRFVITNTAMNKSLQYDVQYGSYGCYPDERGVYPYLYERTVETEAPDDGGNDDGGNTGEAGEYEPQGITWTLGEKAYDKTSGNNAQTGTVNGVQVNDMLKLGTSSLTGDAVLHIPAGTKKVGFYLIAWKDKTATVKASVDGKEVASITPKANAGATGNPPYTITITSDDWYEVEVNSSAAVDMKVETTDKANGRVIFIGLKAITE